MLILSSCRVLHGFTFLSVAVGEAVGHTPSLYARETYLLAIEVAWSKARQ